MKSHEKQICFDAFIPEDTQKSISFLFKMSSFVYLFMKKIYFRLSTYIFFYISCFHSQMRINLMFFPWLTNSFDIEARGIFYLFMIFHLNSNFKKLPSLW